MQQQGPQSHNFNNSYLPNGPSGPVAGAKPLLPNQGRVVQHGGSRILCVADVRGTYQSQAILAPDCFADDSHQATFDL